MKNGIRNLGGTRNIIVGRYFMPFHTFQTEASLGSFLSGFDKVRRCTIFAYANPELEATFQKHGYRKFRATETVILDLTKSEQALWKDMHRKRRNGIRYAIRHGVTVKPQETQEEFETFVAMWHSIHERRSWKKHPKGLDPEWWENSKSGSKLFLALFEGKIIACVRVKLRPFRESKNCFPPVPTPYYFANTSLDEYHYLRPNDLLVWEVIKWLKNNGYKQFNFVGPSRFKMEFSRTDRVVVDGWIKGESKIVLKVNRLVRRLWKLVRRFEQKKNGIAKTHGCHKERNRNENIP